MIPAMASKKADAPKGVSEWSDRLWFLRKRLGMSHDDFADLCGVKRLRILQLEKTKKLAQNTIAMLAKALKVERATVDAYLTGALPLEDFVLVHKGKTTPETEDPRLLLRRFADRVGLKLETIVTLVGEGPEGMNKLSEVARRGVMSVVYMLGFPIETTVAAALEVMAVRGEFTDDAEEWVAAIRKRLPQKPPSGSFPSSSSQKAAEEVKM